MNNAQERHPVIDILLQKPIKTVVVEKMGTVQPRLSATDRFIDPISRSEGGGGDETKLVFVDRTLEASGNITEILFKCKLDVCCVKKNRCEGVNT